MSKIIIKPLQKALLKLDEILLMPKDEIVRDAAIQRFDYSFELSWKILRRFLKEVYNEDEEVFLDMLKKAAKLGLIENPLVWNECRKFRNYTSHNYSEIGADLSYNQAIIFNPLARQMLANLEKINIKLDE